MLTLGERGVDQDLVRGHDARAPDAGDVDAVGAFGGDLPLGLGQLAGLGELGTRWPSPSGDGDEGRAVAAEAGVVVVAGRLVHLGLPSELGLHGHDRHAVGDLAAVPAPLADPLVDHHVPLGGGQLPAFAQPALLCGAALVEDQGGHTADPAQLADGIFVTLPSHHPCVGGQVCAPVRFGFLGHHDRVDHAFGLEVAGERGHLVIADGGLSPGHRDRAVVQDPEGDVRPGPHRAPQRGRPGVEEGAIADVLHEVVVVDEGLEPDPRRPLGPHRDEVGHAALLFVHERIHGVAADPAADQLPVHRDRGPVVRAARAVVRRPVRHRHIGAFADRHDLGEAAHDARMLAQAGAEALDDEVLVELTVEREQHLAPLVPLAHDPRTGPVEDLLELPLDQPALLLDDHDLLEAVGELPHDPRLDGVDHAELQHPDPQAVQLVLIEAHVGEGLQQVGVGLAGGDDADTVPLTADHDAVEAVGTGEGLRRGEALLEQMAFEFDGRGGQEHEVVRLLEVELGKDDRGVVRVDPDGLAPVAEVGRAFHGDPHPREPGHRDRLEAEGEHLPDRGRADHRHPHGHEGELAGVGDRGALRGRVVAGERERSAMPPPAGEVGVAEDVAGAIHAGALPVPDAGESVEARMREALEHLAAHHGTRGNLLVDPRHVHHVEGVEVAARLLEGHVVAAQRRAGVPGDERARAQPGGTVAARLIHRQADEGLDPRKEDRPLGAGVLVFECRHGCQLCLLLRTSRNATVPIATTVSGITKYSMIALNLGKASW